VRIPIICAALLAACTVRPPPATIAWRDNVQTFGPATVQESAADGYLKVETDTDLKAIGRRTFFNVRRPYDIYSIDGHMLRGAVDNDGGQFGELAAMIQRPAGRYVIGSTWCTTYKMLQVRVAPNVLTVVPEAAWEEARTAYSDR
jgi:hypothetical protein